MKPSELFGVVGRGIGLCILLCGLYWLMGGVRDTVYFILSSLGLIGEQDTYAIPNFVDGIAASLVGVFLLRKSQMIVKFAYPDESNDVTRPSA